MKIYVSTACLSTNANLWNTLRALRESRLIAVELGACSGVQEDTDALAARLEQTGLEFLVHNYFPPPSRPFVLNLASADPAISQQSLEFVRRALALTARLRAPFYSVHAGFITDPTGFDKASFVLPMPASSGDAQLALDRFIAALRIALDWAQHLGVQLLIENNVCSEELRGKLLLQTADEFLELFHVLPSPHLGMLLDTGHLNVTAHTLGFDRMTVVDQVAPYVRAFHVHDNNGTADAHQPVQPGSWVLDVLHRPEFTGLPIVVEAKFDDVTGLRRHIDWLKDELESK